MRKVWVLRNTAIPTSFFVASNKASATSADKARWFQSEHHANQSLTFNMKHEGFVATNVLVSITQQYRHQLPSC